MKASFRSGLLVALLFISAAVGIFFFIDRVACLFQTPFKSAIYGADNSFYFYWLRSPVIDGDFDFRNDLYECPTTSDDQRKDVILYALTDKGMMPNKYPVGWAVSNLPSYLVAHWGLGLFNFLTGAAVPRNGYGPAYQLAIHLTQLGYGILGLWAAWLILRKWFDRETAALAILLTWLGSFLVVYQTSYLSMPHSLIFSATAGCFLCTQRLEGNPQSWRWWWGTGLLAGLMVITRYQTLIYLLYPACVATSALIRKPSLASRYFTAVFAGFAVLSLQLVAWKMLYGKWLLYSYTGEKFFWFQPQLSNVLFSPFHGLFYWHPILLLGAIGFFLFFSRQRGWERVWVLSAILTWYINAAWQCWWFGASFGSRAFESCILFFMVGIAFLLQITRSRALVSGCLIGLISIAIIFNLLLAFTIRKNVIPMEEPVSHSQMVEKIWRFIAK